MKLTGRRESSNVEDRRGLSSGAKAGITGFDWLVLVLISFVLPAVFSLIINAGLKKIGWVKDSDLKL